MKKLTVAQYLEQFGRAEVVTVLTERGEYDKTPAQVIPGDVVRVPHPQTGRYFNIYILGSTAGALRK